MSAYLPRMRSLLLAIGVLAGCASDADRARGLVVEAEHLAAAQAEPKSPLNNAQKLVQL